METKDIEVMRHSLAHIMASSIQKKWPKVKFGVGPAIENGFYYDIDLGKDSLSEEDFKDIEREMYKIISNNEVFEKIELPIEKAITWAKDNKQDYKVELLNDLKRAGTTLAKDLNKDELGTLTDKVSKVKDVSLYKNGNFTDLCKGPHVKSTKEVGKFKLIRVSGAYWRGNSNNKQMQRVYGVAFKTDSELKDYLKKLEEAHKRDHRKLGQELDLYVISPLVGSGLPLFTPRGTIIREELNRYSQELRENIGYQKVWVPHIAKKDLYEKSGHWAKFGDEWLKVDSSETKDKLVMKPMNCPHHIQIYSSNPRSYRDLPIKYMETTTVYRDEKAGELLGLARVRSITQDDSHVFCTIDQIEDVMTDLVNIVKNFYKTIGLDLKVRLSFKDDSDDYIGSNKLWDKAQLILKDIAKKTDLKYFEAPGEAAFYGPKIDFLAEDALGREIQVATPQLDFVQPDRFDIKYTDQDGKEVTPVMVHFALLGSIERFMAIYIEHTAGKFPTWVAPEQLRLITVNQEDKTVKFAKTIEESAKKSNIRVLIDNSNESVGKKIRSSEIYKIPYSIVIGEKEINTNKVIPRMRNDLNKFDYEKSLGIDTFIKTLDKEIKTRSTHSLLK